MPEIEELRAEIAALRKEIEALRAVVVIVKSGPDHHMPYQPPAIWPRLPPSVPTYEPYPTTMIRSTGQIGRLATNGAAN